MRVKAEWTDDEKASVAELAQDGRPPKEIAAVMGRSGQAVAALLRAMEQERAAAVPAVDGSRPWNKADAEALALLARLGRTRADMALALGRSEAFVAAKDDGLAKAEARPVGRNWWTDDDDALLLLLRGQGWDSDRIAAFAGRTVVSARGRMRRLGLMAEDAKQEGRVRPCMCCGRSFMSEGIHNRICMQCKEAEVWRS